MNLRFQRNKQNKPSSKSVDVEVGGVIKNGAKKLMKWKQKEYKNINETELVL